MHQSGYLRQLVGSNVIGIAVWHAAGRVIDTNEAFLRIVGYDRDDLISGRVPWTDLIPPESHDSIERAQQSFETCTEETLLVRLRPHGWSSISREEVQVFLREGKESESVGSLVQSRAIPSLHPDLPLDTALRYVDRFHMIPVVNRANVRELEGVVTKRDVLDRYRDFGGE